ncbi:TRAP transporter small permease subunit [Salinarimonas sp. NSM]|uniref:TRAP transporter small permease subunit n=1 Tax=Salinarimonas sp. NSM TaxID=3458003 RepID=UPI0040369ACC
MPALIAFVRAVERVNDLVGRAVALLTLGTVLVCFATVYTRYALNTNFIWLQEAYVWQHALVIVLGGAYTMMVGGFVRVDIFYGRMPPRGRATVDILGTLVFLMPFLAVLAWSFWRFFWNGWLADEGSPNEGGLPNWWLLQGALVVFVALTFLQGCALVARSLLVLKGREEFAPRLSHG